MNLVDYSHSYLSVVPPLMALVLAIITRRVVISLSIGILVGSLLLAEFSPLKTIEYLWQSASSLFFTIDEGEFSFSWDKVNILLFLIFLGILTNLLTISGSNRAFADWAEKHIKSKKGATLMPALLVFVTFIDDYFHSLAVGAISRPVTDKFKVSRAKLAYILDSTAAPMCVMMPISSWGAYIITLIAGILSEHSITGYSAMGAFVNISILNFYAIFSLVLVFYVSYSSFDIYSMRRFEEEALHSQQNQELDNHSGVKGRMINLVLPVLFLILASISAMIYTGAEALAADNKAFSILGAFENTVVGKSLVFGGFISLLTITICIVIQKQISFKEYLKAYLVGAKSMYGAILILCFAWTINHIVSDMKTGQYLANLVSDKLPIMFLPAILFLLSAVMAFATGTSWGTFGIMLSIAAAMTSASAPELTLPALAAVMAGSVCGDHCSPISDTTILSSTGAKCNHIDHVTSQLPYVILVAISSVVGYLVIGYSRSIFLGFTSTAMALIALIFILKNMQNPKTATQN